MHPKCFFVIIKKNGVSLKTNNKKIGNTKISTQELVGKHKNESTLVWAVRVKFLETNSVSLSLSVYYVWYCQYRGCSLHSDNLPSVRIYTCINTHGKVYM